MTLVIMVEGDSEPFVIRSIIDKLGLSRNGIQIVKHKGANALETSLSRKLRAYTDPDTKFLVMRDNDGGNCIERKKKLMKIAANAGKADDTTIRIVCQEIEAWFLGDPKALEAAGLLKKDARPPLLKRDPDSIAKPSVQLKRLVGQHTKKRNYQKIAGARKIASRLNIGDNKSKSFNHTVQSIKSLTGNG